MWRLHWRRAIFYSAITKRQHVSYIGKAWLESLGKRFPARVCVCSTHAYARSRSVFLRNSITHCCYFPQVCTRNDLTVTVVEFRKDELIFVIILYLDVINCQVESFIGNKKKRKERSICVSLAFVFYTATRGEKCYITLP